MKDYKNILKALECCAVEEKAHCDECPYKENNCRQKDRDALELIEELKAQLKPECDHESLAQSHSKEICKLNDKLTVAEMSLERAQQELAEAQRELIHLRTVKATAEAFLRVKI